MKPAKKNRITIESVKLPASRAEVSTLIEEIALLQGSIADVEKRVSERVARIQKEGADDVAPLKRRLAERAREVHAFCVAHRDSLTGGGRIKTVRFPAGTCSWRMSGGKVSIKGAKDVLARLKTLGAAYRKFIRTKESIDKEAMLKDPQRAALVEGVAIEQGEIFAIKPVTTDIEEMV